MSALAPQPQHVLPHGPQPSLISKVLAGLPVALWLACCRCVCVPHRARRLCCHRPCSSSSSAGAGGAGTAGGPSLSLVSSSSVSSSSSVATPVSMVTPRPRPKIRRKALVLGLPGAGKTEFVGSLVRLQQQPAASTPFPSSAAKGSVPTQGFQQQCVTGSVFLWTFLEVGGEFKKYWGKYDKGVHGLVYVVDGSASLEALNASMEALEGFLVEGQSHSGGSGRGLAARVHWPMLLLVSHCDRAGCLLEQTRRVIQARRSLQAVHVGERSVFGVSARSSAARSPLVCESAARGAMEWFEAAVLRYSARLVQHADAQ